MAFYFRNYEERLGSLGAQADFPLTLIKQSFVLDALRNRKTSSVLMLGRLQ
jgi:hypothetical protein